MKNLIVLFMVSLFTTQLLATQMVTATKFETAKTELSVMVKPIVFENVQLDSGYIKPIVFENLYHPEPIIGMYAFESQYIKIESVNYTANTSTNKRIKPNKWFDYNKPNKWFDYNKHYKNNKKYTLLLPLLNTYGYKYYRKLNHL